MLTKVPYAPNPDDGLVDLGGVKIRSSLSDFAVCRAIPVAVFGIADVGRLIYCLTLIPGAFPTSWMPNIRLWGIRLPMAQRFGRSVQPTPLGSSRHLRGRQAQAARMSSSSIRGPCPGACSSLWMAFHDDMADPKGADPIAHESTRLASPILPDHQLIVFAVSYDYFLGLVHSRVHEVWARAQGTQLLHRPRQSPVLVGKVEQLQNEVDVLFPRHHDGN